MVSRETLDARDCSAHQTQVASSSQRGSARTGLTRRPIRSAQRVPPPFVRACGPLWATAHNQAPARATIRGATDRTASRGTTDRDST